MPEYYDSLLNLAPADNTRVDMGTPNFDIAAAQASMDEEERLKALIANNASIQNQINSGANHMYTPQQGTGEVTAYEGTPWYDDAYYTMTRPMTAIKEGTMDANKIKFGDYNPLDFPIQYTPVMSAITAPEDFMTGMEGLKPIWHDLSKRVRTDAYDLVGASPYDTPEEEAADPYQAGMWDYFGALGAITQMGPAMNSFYRNMDNLKGFARSNVNAVNDNITGLKHGYSEYTNSMKKDPTSNAAKNARTLGEIFPITDAQRKASYAGQDAAMKEADWFNQAWLYPNQPHPSTGRARAGDSMLRPEVRQRMENLAAHGTMDDVQRQVNTMALANSSNKNSPNNPLNEKPSLLVNTSRHRDDLAPAVIKAGRIGAEKVKSITDKDSQWVKENRRKILGVNTDDASITARNRGLYSYPPNKVLETAIHEGAHSWQKMGKGTVNLSKVDNTAMAPKRGMIGADGKMHYDYSNVNRHRADSWSDQLSSWDPTYKYYVPNPSTKPGKYLAKAMVDPTVPTQEKMSMLDKAVSDTKGPSWDATYDSWLSSPDELHSELMPLRYEVARALVNELGMSWEQAIQKLQRPSDAIIDEMLRANLNKHFKPGTSQQNKRNIIRALPSLVGAGAIGAGALGTEEQQ